MDQGFPPPIPPPVPPQGGGQGSMSRGPMSPLSGGSPMSGGPPVPVSIQVGRYFRFAWRQGWAVQENTNMLCVNSPDGNAAIMAVGLVGMLQPFTHD